ncbi:MAG: hypothetical protein HFJ42_02720 [Clostridia bacterium]|nr:hypothetical protein [Clostridia bacterium]
MLDYKKRIEKVKQKAKKIEQQYEEQRKKEEAKKREEQQKLLQIQKQRMRNIFLKYIIEILEENVGRVERITIRQSRRIKYDNEEDGLDIFYNKTEEIFIIEISYKYEGKHHERKYEIEPCIVGYGIKTFNDFMYMKYGEEETNSIILEDFLKVEFNVEEPKSIIVTPNYED